MTNMPIIKPVPIKTRDLKWWRRLLVWIFSTRKWILVEDYICQIGMITYFIPKDFVFDGASIPKPFWWFLSPVGLLFIPAIFHDYMYHNHELLMLDDNNKIEIEKVTRFQADNYFLYFNYRINMIVTADLIAWLAVRLFGRSSYKK